MAGEISDEAGVCAPADRTVLLETRISSDTPSEPFDLPGEGSTFLTVTADYDYRDDSLFSNLASLIVFPADGDPADAGADGFGYDRQGQFRRVTLPPGRYRIFSGKKSPEILAVSCP